MNRRLLYIVAALLLTSSVCGQELKCNVTLNYEAVQSANKETFEHLKQSISEFINNTLWTNMTFAETEKIECNMLIVVSSVSEDNLYSTELQVQSNRPIWGTSYNSPVMNFKDNQFNFTYQDFDQIHFDKSSYTTNLAAMLAYYAYLIIGFDCDSYAKLSGTPCFQICENICTLCQSASMNDTEQKGWKAFDSNRNRYALINNLMDDAFKEYRAFSYTYHRLGLDEMSANVINGRAHIAQDFKVLQEANRARPATYVVNTFLDAKSDELVNIFSKGTNEEKEKVHEILTSIDPTRSDLYDKIMK